jgi:hypothetical protein
MPVCTIIVKEAGMRMQSCEANVQNHTAQEKNHEQFVQEEEVNVKKLERECKHWNIVQKTGNIE